MVHPNNHSSVTIDTYKVSPDVSLETTDSPPRSDRIRITRKHQISVSYYSHDDIFSRLKSYDSVLPVAKELLV